MPFVVGTPQWRLERAMYAVQDASDILGEFEPEDVKKLKLPDGYGRKFLEAVGHVAVAASDLRVILDECKKTVDR